MDSDLGLDDTWHQGDDDPLGGDLAMTPPAPRPEPVSLESLLPPELRDAAETEATIPSAAELVDAGLAGELAPSEDHDPVGEETTRPSMPPFSSGDMAADPGPMSSPVDSALSTPPPPLPVWNGPAPAAPGAALGPTDFGAPEFAGAEVALDPAGPLAEPAGLTQDLVSSSDPVGAAEGGSSAPLTSGLPSADPIPVDHREEGFDSEPIPVAPTPDLAPAWDADLPPLVGSAYADRSGPTQGAPESTGVLGETPFESTSAPPPMSALAAEAGSPGAPAADVGPPPPPPPPAWDADLPPLDGEPDPSPIDSPAPTPTWDAEQAPPPPAWDADLPPLDGEPDPSPIDSPAPTLTWDADLPPLSGAATSDSSNDGGSAPQTLRVDGESEHSNTKPLLIGAGVLAVALLGIGGMFALTRGGGDETASQSTTAEAPADDGSEQASASETEPADDSPGLILPMTADELGQNGPTLVETGSEPFTSVEQPNTEADGGRLRFLVERTATLDTPDGSTTTAATSAVDVTRTVVRSDDDGVAINLAVDGSVATLNGEATTAPELPAAVVRAFSPGGGLDPTASSPGATGPGNPVETFTRLLPSAELGVGASWEWTSAGTDSPFSGQTVVESIEGDIVVTRTTAQRTLPERSALDVDGTQATVTTGSVEVVQTTSYAASTGLILGDTTEATLTADLELADGSTATQSISQTTRTVEL